MTTRRSGKVSPAARRAAERNLGCATAAHAEARLEATPEGPLPAPACDAHAPPAAPIGEKRTNTSPHAGDPLGSVKVDEKTAGFFANDAFQNGAKPQAARPRGRPRVLDEKTKGVIAGMLVLGVSRRKVADYVGCHYTTIANEAKRDPQFAHDMQQAEVQSQTLPLTEIYHAAKSNWRAAAWLVARRDRLKRQQARRKKNAGDANRRADC